MRVLSEIRNFQIRGSNATIEIERKFIESHSPEDKELKEIPRAQLKAIKPTLERIFATDGETGIA